MTELINFQDPLTQIYILVFLLGLMVLFSQKIRTLGKKTTDVYNTDMIVNGVYIDSIKIKEVQNIPSNIEGIPALQRQKIIFMRGEEAKTEAWVQQLIPKNPETLTTDTDTTREYITIQNDDERLYEQINTLNREIQTLRNDNNRLRATILKVVVEESEKIGKIKKNLGVSFLPYDSQRGGSQYFGGGEE